MDLILLLQAIASFSVLFFIYYLQRGLKSKRNGPKKPPEVAGRWPVIGHLHLLPKNESLANIFRQWADNYGPIFTVWIGCRRTVVVSSWEQAKECFTTNDKVLATRPRSAAGKYLCDNYSILGLMPYGPLWREVRKMAMLELLSTHRLESFARLRASEIGQWMKQLHHLWVENERLPVKVEMKEQLQDLTFNMMLMMVAQKRYFGRNFAGSEEEAKRARKAIAQFFYYFGTFVLSDGIPWLEWFDVMGHIGEMKRVAKELHSLFSVWWEEHLRRRQDANWKGDRDFIDMMVSMMDEGQISDHANSVIKTLPLVPHRSDQARRSEVESLQKDKEQLKINQHRAEKEVKLLFEENKRFRRLYNKEMQLHASGGKHTGIISSTKGKRKSSPRVTNSVERMIDFSDQGSSPRWPLSPLL